MLGHVPASLLRRFRNHPSSFLINVGGLAVAFATCLLIGLYLHTELRYDQFHEKSDRIVAAKTLSDAFGETRSTPWALGTTLDEHSPRVEAVVRLRDSREFPLRRTSTEKPTSVQRLRAEPGFFDIFTFPALHGDASAALAQPGSVLITQETARRLFEDPDPRGETLLLGEDEEEVTVRAVLKSPPSTSSITFDVVQPLGDPIDPTGWRSLNYQTYLLFDRPMTADAASQHIRQVTDAQKEERAPAFGAIALPDLYLSSLYSAEGFRGQMRYLYVFGTAALLVLLVAGINYVNLATVQGARRARDIAVRKTMGATAGRLARQLLSESVALAWLAGAVALGLATAVLPAFNGLMETNIALLDTPLRIAGLLWACSTVVGLLAGAYPAGILARSRASRVLQRHGRTTTHGNGWLHRGLVVLQFAVSVVLIGGTVVLYQQLQYVQTKDLGFQEEQVATLSLPPEARLQAATVRDNLTAHASVKNATVATGFPAHSSVYLGLAPTRWSPAAQVETDETVTFLPFVVDAHYAETLGLEVVAGRTFDRDRPADLRTGVLLNEAAARRLGWTPEEAVGQPFSARFEEPREVLGVVRNFHVESLREEVKPVVFTGTDMPGVSVPRQMAVRFAGGQIARGVDHVESVIAGVDASAAVNLTFLDDTFDAMYRSEQRLGRLFAGFAVIAIVIACLGLYGLAAHAVEQRTKEIGIRKALGASIRNVVALVSREYAVLVGVALAAGVPVAYLLMQQWLAEFAYRIHPGVFTFGVTALLAVAVAALGVGGQAVRAATLDPVTALRDE
jgi:putative ABC transport system permease protein